MQCKKRNCGAMTVYRDTINSINKKYTFFEYAKDFNELTSEMIKNGALKMQKYLVSGTVNITNNSFTIESLQTSFKPNNAQ